MSYDCATNRLAWFADKWVWRAGVFAESRVLAASIRGTDGVFIKFAKAATEQHDNSAARKFDYFAARQCFNSAAGQRYNSAAGQRYDSAAAQRNDASA